MPEATPEITAKRAEADQIVRNHILWSMGGGLVPFPLLDIAAVTAIQVDMLRQLAELYDADYSQSEGKTYVTALGSSSLARLGASAIKLIPGVGTILGGMSMSVLSGASTYAVGNVSIRHFEGSGSLMDVDMNWAKDAYKKAFDKGKSVAEKLKKEKEANPAPDDEKAIIRALYDLQKQYDAGELSSAEYNKQKQALMAKL